jgi:hypothetical protein
MTSVMVSVQLTLAGGKDRSARDAVVEVGRCRASESIFRYWLSLLAGKYLKL